MIYDKKFATKETVLLFSLTNIHFSTIGFFNKEQLFLQNFPFTVFSLCRESTYSRQRRHIQKVSVAASLFGPFLILYMYWETEHTDLLQFSFFIFLTYCRNCVVSSFFLKDIVEV